MRKVEKIDTTCERMQIEVQLPFTELPLVITGWKIWGWCGGLMFTGRWFVQLYYTRKLKRPTFPIVYWYMSLAGSMMVLSYFIFGKNDSVGIISNLFPPFVASYNLFMELTHRKQTQSGGDQPQEEAS